MKIFRYIGTCSETTTWVDKEGRARDYDISSWALLEGPFGIRRAKYIGSAIPGMESLAAQELRAKVRAWKRGGPLPPMVSPAASDPHPMRVIEGGKQ